MMDSLFIQKLLRLVFDNTLQKKKLLLASEMYLTSSIEIVEKSNDAILFNIDGELINISYQNNRIVSYKDNKMYYIDEKVIACALYYKRQHYIKNEIYFTMNDIQLNTHYYSSYFISSIYYEDYQYRFNFYYGLIDELYKLKLYDFCIKIMLDLFGVLDVKFTYDSKYTELSKQNLFKVVKDKYNLLYEHSDEIIQSFNMNLYPIITLGKFLYITVINKPVILKNTNIKKIYDFVFDNYLNILKNTQLYNDLKKQYTIIEWYNKEKDNEYIEKRINTYEVMICYIDYLFELKDYNKMYNLFNDYKFSIINNETLNKLIYGYYQINRYEDIIKLFKFIKNMNFNMYLNFKNELPLLFNDKYINIIMEVMIDISNEEESRKIIEFEGLAQYKLIIDAKKDFNIINNNFNNYLGIYDEQLLKIYQKEITNNLLQIRGYYNGIPEFIMEKLEKLRKVKNGKYYILEILEYVNEKTYLSFSKELEQYCESLGV